jgi:flagellin
VRAPNADVAGGQLDSDSFFTLNGVTITDFSVQEDDSDDALQNQINAVSDQTGVIASLDEDSRLVLTAVDGRNIHVDVSDADASAITGLAVGETVEFAAIELSSDKQFEITGANVGFVGFAADRIIGVNNNNTVQTVNVLDRGAANRSLEVIDRALEQVSSQRSKLGALHNRFESTIRNLNTMNENISASKSRVTDADFAKESAELARNQILQQAASTILAQANQSSQVALSLLG